MPMQAPGLVKWDCPEPVLRIPHLRRRAEFVTPVTGWTYSQPTLVWVTRSDQGDAARNWICNDGNRNKEPRREDAEGLFDQDPDAQADRDRAGRCAPELQPWPQQAGRGREGEAARDRPRRGPGGADRGPGCTAGARRTRLQGGAGAGSGAQAV